MWPMLSPPQLTAWRQAVIIAAVFEFVGALLLGRVSTCIIAKGVADVKAFKINPEVYSYGIIYAD
jgi:solute carrier family 20 (sodium-dependent phosphate transporter)